MTNFYKLLFNPDYACPNSNTILQSSNQNTKTWFLCNALCNICIYVPIQFILLISVIISSRVDSTNSARVSYPPSALAPFSRNSTRSSDEEQTVCSLWREVALKTNNQSRAQVPPLAVEISLHSKGGGGGRGVGGWIADSGWSNSTDQHMVRYHAQLNRELQINLASSKSVFSWRPSFDIDFHCK